MAEQQSHMGGRSPDEEDTFGSTNKRSRVGLNDEEPDENHVTPVAQVEDGVPQASNNLRAPSDLYQGPLHTPSDVPAPHDAKHPLHESTSLPETYISTTGLQETLPAKLADHFQRMQTRRASPEPALEEQRPWLDQTAELGQASESGFSSCHHMLYLAKLLGGGLLQQSGNQPGRTMKVHKADNNHNVAQLVLQYFYGYPNTNNGGITSSELTTIGRIYPKIPGISAARDAEPVGGVHNQQPATLFPYLCMGFAKSYGPHSGSMAVPNFKSGSTVTVCVEIIEQLNEAVRAQGGSGIVDDWIYCITGTCTRAQVYIAWKSASTGFVVQRLGQFPLQVKYSRLALRDLVRNIIDWGSGDRLTQIKAGLAAIMDNLTRSSQPVGHMGTT